MNHKIIKLSRNTHNAPQNTIHSQTVAFSHYNNISAQLPIDPTTNKIVSTDIKEQINQCLSNLESIIKSIGHAKEDIIKINIFLTNILDIDAIDDIYANFFQDYYPTRMVIAVEALPIDGALVQIDAVISNGEGTHPQQPCQLIKMARNTDSAPKNALSTQTVAFSHYNNITAQLPINPKTGLIISDNISEQTEQCLNNIKAILESINVPLDDIVKINIHLKNLKDIDAVNEAYSTFFPDSAIARSVAYVPAQTVTIASALPMNALIQIDAVVSHGDGTPPQAVEDRHDIVIRASNTDNAPQNSMSTQTVAFSHYNHISAQLPINPTNSEISIGNIKEQAKQCLQNIKAIVESINHTMDDIVKINIQLTNVADINIVDDVYVQFFNNDRPARTVIGVSAIPMNSLIQIEAVVSNAEGTPLIKH
ncbi:RidA family protein [Aliivibrio sp. EL58]|uniref:RidA family protein n=1 Tax=Aliivibrio sp. EL58 TaxID=2107582 RepID=UPI000EFA50BD|nr:RidA family protein [Aliivibrio sp. EL58]